MDDFPQEIMGLETTMAESVLDSGLRSHRRTGRVTLVVLSGGIRDLRFELKLRESTIGRHSQCNICVPSDDVSREHVKITRDVDGIAKIIDLESTNGTFVNHHRVDVEVLREGDRIALGRQAALDVRYEYVDVSGPGDHLATCPSSMQTEQEEDIAELRRLQLNLTIRQEHLGEDHPAVAVILHDIARCHQKLGNLTAAFDGFDHALKIYENAGPEFIERAHTLIAQGECRLHQGSFKAAIRPLRTGLEMLESRRASDFELAPGRFVLAQTMMDLDLSRSQALVYATASRQGYADGGDATRSKFIEVDRWIRKLEVSNDTRVSNQHGTHTLTKAGGK